MNDDPPRDGAALAAATPLPVPQLLVERLALGELPPERAAQLRKRLTEEPGGLARLEAIAADNTATLEELPAPFMARRIESAVQENTSSAETPAGTGSWLRWGVPLSAFAATALILLVVPGQPSEVEQHLDPESRAYVSPNNLGNSSTERAKGAPNPHLVVVRQAPDGSSSNLNDGELASQGDVIQLGYLAVGARYGAILSVDGRGTVTWHFPSEGPDASAPGADFHSPGSPSNGHQAPALVVKGEQWLSEAYELDDAPSFERFIFITGAKPFDIREVHAAAKTLASGPDAGQGARLKLADNLRQASMTLRKSPESKRAVAPEETPLGSQD